MSEVRDLHDILSENIRLKAQLAERDERLKEYSQHHEQHHLSDIGSLKSAREALEKYGGHKDQCNPLKLCTCGFENAIAKAELDKE